MSATSINQLSKASAQRLVLGVTGALISGPTQTNQSENMTDTSTDTSYRVSADELRQFIERYERLEAEKKDIADAQKEVMAEAKGRGYDTRVMRKLVAMRRRDRDDLAEEEAVLDLYKEALGM